MYVVNLSEEERGRLDEFIRKGKRPAQLLTKARILLKANISEAGEGWSDSRIAEALDTSIATVERTRRSLSRKASERARPASTIPNAHVHGYSTAWRRRS
jgi:FixJ family two-component response regulator